MQLSNAAIYKFAFASAMWNSASLALGEELVPKAPVAIVDNFTKRDNDRDKYLSIEEFKAWCAANTMATSIRDFQMVDRDKDEQLSLEEYWSLPTHPIGERGPLHDPISDLVDKYVGVLDESLGDWDKKPDTTVSSSKFIDAFMNVIKEPLTSQMEIDADPNQDGVVSREEAKRFVEIQSGMRRSGGDLLRIPNGQLVQHRRFVNADQNRDDRLSKAELRAGAQLLTVTKPEELDALDTDKDSFVSWVEWSKVRLDDPIADFRRMDVIVDGQLEPTEVQAGTPQWCKLTAQIAFPTFDQDANGKLSLDEFRLTFYANLIANWQNIISDTDDDGLISRREFSYGGVFPLLRVTYFEMLDANHDGKLDSNEFVFKIKVPRQVFSLNADGSGWTKLFQLKGFPALGSPSVSPDGKLIALDANVRKEDLSRQMMLITDFEGNVLQNLGVGMMPTWSKDGSRLSFSKQGMGVGVINADGTNVRSLVSSGWGALWSPDGEKIAYYNGLKIMIFDVAREKSFQCYDAKDYSEIYWNMAWSPDSQRICFKGLKKNNTQEIATVGINPAKQEFKVHVSGQGIVPGFAWHPDNKRIVFVMNSPERAKAQLYEFDPNNTEKPRLVEGQDPTIPNTSACWTTDGKRLIVINGNY